MEVCEVDRLKQALSAWEQCWSSLPDIRSAAEYMQALEKLQRLTFLLRLSMVQQSAKEAV